MKIKATNLPGKVFYLDEVKDGTTVETLLFDLKMDGPTHHTGSVQVNGRRVPSQHKLKDGDFLAVINRIYGD